MTQEQIDVAVKQAIDVGAQQRPAELSGLLQFLADKDLESFIEIGTASGGTFGALCQAIPRGIKVAVDAWMGLAPWPRMFAPESETDPETFMTRLHRMQNYSTQVCVVEGSSHEDTTRDKVRWALEGNLVGFMLIDGDHRYEGAKLDYERYSQFVRPGGYIGFHDVNDTEFARSKGCFVGQLWNELQGNKVEFNEHGHNMGIGVIQYEP